MDDLHAIIDYNMTEDEAQGYKIAVLWQEMAPQVFPEYTRHASLRKRGDPRKSTLFKVGHTLYTRTKGLLPPDQYKFYIKAQLDILKELSKETEDLYIDPQCLLGDKAWMRWLVWKRKYDAVCKTRMVAHMDVRIHGDKLRSELQRSRMFLIAKFGNHQKDNILGSVSDLIRWAATSKVSVFYLVLSPWCASIKADEIPIDLGYYRGQLMPESQDIFKTIFPEEAGDEPRAETAQ